MKYAYYPGCSLENTAREYDLSARAFLAACGVQLAEIDGWTCCGASAAETSSRLLSLALPARNLALAQAQHDGAGGPVEILAPCSACYLNLRRAEDVLGREPKLMDMVNEVLADEGLHLNAPVRVRHLLDVAAVNIGPDCLKSKITRPMNGVVAAPYYGCQCLRPYADFDDPELPMSMNGLLVSTGAEVLTWRMGATCCGASHMTVKRRVGLELVSAILMEARPADVIVTVCPMCQMNLEAWQKDVSKNVHSHIDLAVLYLPQFLGLAMGLDQHELGLELNLNVSDQFRRKAGL